MRIAAVALAIVLGAAPALAQNNPPAPKTTDLGNGISVIFGQGGNIGVSSGPDGAFVIDDQYPNTAAANLDKIREISGGAPRYLVNTHWHGDHAGGNAAFAQAGAMIFAHENVRKRLSGEVRSLGLNGQPAAASPEPAWPVITFVDGVDFHLNGETIRVFKVRASHTDGDSMIHFVEPDILHMGDVFFNGLFPVIDPGSGGSVRGYLEAMKDTLKIVDADTKIIPGHGDMGTKADLEKQIAMLDGAIKAVEARIKAGDTLQQTIARKPLKPWANFAWSFIGEDAFTTTLYNGLKQ
ncbi:MAG TPA: MBL fold metallo-hydrolase [Hyphomonadaceae bacterium]|nr:MBL fold metallo-hydrolase [Hyphomonadaceae bacterium]